MGKVTNMAFTCMLVLFPSPPGVFPAVFVVLPTVLSIR